MSIRIPLACALLAIGCSHRQLAPSTADEPFRIGREDLLDIAVWRDADLSRVLPVRPDGFISLPMVGEVRAEGLTPVELSDELKDRLRPYVQDPRVTVIVREVNSSRVYVTGEVAHPGSYPLRGKASLLHVLALAGGFTDFADRDGILLIRGQGRYPVRFTDLVTDEDDQRVDVPLMPGDTVVVP